MALSNWDSFSINETGNPKMDLVSPSGIKLEIYKNWLYISDEIAWQEGDGYSEPIVMEIFNSELRYKDMTIVSDFIDNSIYVIAWTGYSHKNTLRALIGCGVYGFKGEEYIGVAEEHINTLKQVLNDEKHWFSIPNELKKIDLTKGKRFNQGDMFFHKEIGTDKQCSSVGNAKEPILSKALKRDDK